MVSGLQVRATDLNLRVGPLPVRQTVRVQNYNVLSQDKPSIRTDFVGPPDPPILFFVCFIFC